MVDILHGVGIRSSLAEVCMSLKSLVETGQGRPSPDDIKIDNWN